MPVGVSRGASCPLGGGQTGPRADGKNVEDVVGAIPLALNQGFTHPDTQVIGYPYLPGDDKYKPNQNPLTCTTPTKKYTTANADGWTGGTCTEVNCKGYVSGTSGGPFLIKMGNGRGLAGITGGWKTGGHSPDTSYSSYFGDDVKRIYDAAVAGKQRQPKPGSVLPPGETWRDYTRGIASGYFTVDDDRMDIVVRWKDGEVTLYPSVDENGFHGEIQLLAPNDDWKKYAQQMTTGRFSGNGRQDDLVVRWSDGEVSQYTDVSERGIGTETMAQAPNQTWTHAAEIASGDYTCNDNWDLIIRWSDGELTNYQDEPNG